jgi:hypothetical protein
MFKQLRIIIWSIVSDLEQRLYPYHNADDYYYEVKNDDTGEKYMIIEWIKSFDERITRLQDEMVWVKSELHLINKDKNG